MKKNFKKDSINFEFWLFNPKTLFLLGLLIISLGYTIILKSDIANLKESNIIDRLKGKKWEKQFYFI